MSAENYSIQMRQALCPKDLITEEGKINHSYFLTKKGFYWSPEDEEALRKGLSLYGVGKWSKIKGLDLSKLPF